MIVNQPLVSDLNGSAARSRKISGSTRIGDPPAHLAAVPSIARQRELLHVGGAVSYGPSAPVARACYACGLESGSDETFDYLSQRICIDCNRLIEILSGSLC